MVLCNSCRAEGYGARMAKLLQHILVNINEDLAMGRLSELPDVH